MSTAQSVIEDAVIEVLAYTGPCTMDKMVGLLPGYHWSEIFSAVDDMSRDGRLVLRRPSNSVYQLSLSRFVRQRNTMSTPVRFCGGCGYLCDEHESENGSTRWVEASRYLKKYGLTWIALDRTDTMCPACSRVLTCAHRRTKMIKA
jgi:hypothetical protein